MSEKKIIPYWRQQEIEREKKWDLESYELIEKTRLMYYEEIGLDVEDLFRQLSHHIVVLEVYDAWTEVRRRCSALEFKRKLENKIDKLDGKENNGSKS